MMHLRKGRNMILFMAGILFLASIIIFIWYMSSQNGDTSFNESGKVAKFIEKIITREFTVDKKDYFWKVTLNLLVRKAAHFIVYIAVGAIVCLVLNVLTGRTMLSLVVSPFACLIVSCMDEYHQMFVPGRTMRLFDVAVDSVGAVLGILAVTLFFYVFRYIERLKLRIRFLENKEAL